MIDPKRRNKELPDIFVNSKETRRGADKRLSLSCVMRILDRWMRRIT